MTWRAAPSGPTSYGGTRHRDEPGRNVRPWVNKNRMVNRERRIIFAPLTSFTLPESRPTRTGRSHKALYMTLTT